MIFGCQMSLPIICMLNIHYYYLINSIDKNEIKLVYLRLEAEDYLIKPLAVVYSNGFVLVIPSKKYVVRCTEDKDHLYTCTITFGSWTYSNKDIDLVLSSDQLDLDLYENKDFEIVDSDVVRTEKKYSCCPELYISLKYTIQLRRKV
ncbi:DgyrCDS14977 [Dimorphilus gyrociliatus]|uniref:DgyrCDS14977 n=1 Tax=Dimorphilus gyrociliatus TaxID=2664684 RepID=A0A7I8WFQ2_9ANNE|nr:DgyrCDS14977 [Dimorphilus gyrociliatus]